jgi:hypothetical protein
VSPRNVSLVRACLDLLRRERKWLLQQNHAPTGSCVLAITLYSFLRLAMDHAEPALKPLQVEASHATSSPPLLPCLLALLCRVCAAS